MKKNLKLHIGCGWRNFGADWIHIDGGSYAHLDYDDITQLAQADNSVDLIYASHVIAYFDREEVIPLLKEWIRVLKIGGTLRLATPNFARYSELYTQGKITVDQCLGPFYGKMPLRNTTIYHKTIYDLSSLTNLLKKLEMKDIKTYDLSNTEHARFDDHSHAFIPHMDFANGTLMSLNVECKK